MNLGDGQVRLDHGDDGMALSIHPEIPSDINAIHEAPRRVLVR